MTSQINPNNIDGTYPVAGQPNNTQGFRDNFTNIKTNFSAAATEITDLENNGVFKAALSGTTLDNNMSDNLIYAVQLNDVSYTALTQTATTGSITLDYSAAQYQTIAPTANISLGFSNWPASGSYGELTINVVVTNTAYTMTLPVAVTLGLTGIQGYSANVITFAATGTYKFKFSTVDSGTTITIYDLNRPLNYYTNAVNVAASTASSSYTTGALIVAGGVGIGGNLYVNGDIFGNLSATDLNLGNVVVSGYISAVGNITGGNINGNITGNITGNINITSANASGNITGGNVLTGGLVSSAGTITSSANITGGNVLTGGLVSSAGNIRTSGFFIGDGGYLSNVTVYSNVAATQIISGTTQLAIEVPSGNMQASINGTANVVVFRSTGVNISGYVTATANITGGNVLTGGLISATGNLYGGNILNSGLNSVTGNITGGNVLTGGLISSTGAITSVANITGGNVLTGGLISSTGAITSVANITGGNVLTGGLISSTGNIIGGNIRTAGLISATANITGGNVLTGGLISSTGNLTSGNIAVTGNISLTGNVIGGNLTTGTQIVATGNITGGNIRTDGQTVVMNATAPPAGGVAAYLMSNTANLGVFFGSGAPTISAAQGSLYLRTDGSSTSTRMYVNINGTTGWTAVTTAA